ncbi:paralemmin-2-like [Cyclopterus lumpus]|uniref:paralemmin-2-like n=1 Tax=Cyclopterus lumpus TaxID=8103 RepID=UPI001486EA08|nr:paralemmin-2-like [Cyclopterus lumpus]
MDEAEKYQQRLQAIAERRRRQEEEERLARETEEERLKTAQEKRKHLREQWLSEAPPPVVDEPATGERTESQKTPEEEEEEEAAGTRSEERASREENKESAVRTHNKAGTAEDAQQVNKEADNLFSVQMAQRMFHESGQEGRSVLGMLAVQVERDPKTGATVVRSVAPVSTPAGVPPPTAVFDDGRKSIHAVGGSGSELSTKELGQILSIVDGVGMTALLDDFQAGAESVDAGGAPEGQVVSFSSRRGSSKEDSAHFACSGGHDLEAELGIEERFASMGHKEDKKEDGSTTAVGDIAGEVGEVEDLRLEEGPVTLVFLGYTDEDQGDGREENGGMLIAERVIITEEGEEHVLGPETPASPLEGKESRVFQDIPLDGNGAGVEVRGEEGGNGRQDSSSPSKATSKSKSCQCCSVM